MMEQWESGSDECIPVEQIVSGAQTGVDRAALDAAIGLGIPHGGWCPRGRLAEDGPISACYDLEETASRNYATRTEQNVIDSDGTLIIYHHQLGGGTELTGRLADKHRKPLFLVDLATPFDLATARNWLRDQGIGVLNVAGPRESSSPGIYRLARDIVETLLRP